MLRHRVDAVNARAQVHTIEIQLEDLLFAELRLDEQRNGRFLRLASVRADVREKQRTRELLRQGAAALDPSAEANVAHRRARDPDRIDARMVIEAEVLDGDHRVLKIERNLRQ